MRARLFTSCFLFFLLSIGCSKKDENPQSIVQSMSFKYNGIVKECKGKILAGRSGNSLMMDFQVDDDENIKIALNISEGKREYSISLQEAQILYEKPDMDYIFNKSGSINLSFLSESVARGTFSSEAITEGKFEVNLVKSK